MDTNRLEQFKQTKLVYDAMHQEKEFIIPTRSEFEVACYLDDNGLTDNVRLVPYEVLEGFNPSKALNLGVLNAKYDQIIITSPEVKPTTDVLTQLEECLGLNVVCQVWDEGEDGKITISLVNTHYRYTSPAMYFLAMFNKKDIETINGWDEKFMSGYAYEDDDFGERWNRAGLPFVIREDIEAIHQYHPRGETIVNGISANQINLNQNNMDNVIRPTNGLLKLDVQ